MVLLSSESVCATLKEVKYIRKAVSLLDKLWKARVSVENLDDLGGAPFCRASICCIGRNWGIARKRCVVCSIVVVVVKSEQYDDDDDPAGQFCCFDALIKAPLVLDFSGLLIHISWRTL